MTSQSLPERANLEQLKNLAKTLLRSARAGEPAALLRFRTLPAFRDKSAAELAGLSLALHDAQSVIAREHGFSSWNALRDEVEARSLSFSAAVEEFLRCATGDAPGRAERLLALHPRLAHASLLTEIVRGDAAGALARLERRPELATSPGGPQGWAPLLYACHTCLCKEAGARSGLVAIARKLLALGADPNGIYVWRWHPELPRTALWAALCTVGDHELAEALLEAGAQPTDGVSMHIAAARGDLATLELLLWHGADVDGIPGGVPPLAYILGFAKHPVGPRWLLEHGADASLAWEASGEAPIHVAARRWDVPMVELLVRHGADVNARRRDGATPHALAALHGNSAVAQWLVAHGAVDELSPLERFVAACARGDGPAADAMLAERPELRKELRREHHLLLRPAESGDAAVLKTMLACGFDPSLRDKDGFTPLHRAAMAGHADAVSALLAGGAPVDALDDTFLASPLVAAVEGSRNARAGSDHVEVARRLIAAGSPLGWDPPQGAPSPEGTLELLAELVRAAGGKVQGDGEAT